MQVMLALSRSILPCMLTADYLFRIEHVAGETPRGQFFVDSGGFVKKRALQKFDYLNEHAHDLTIDIE